jgi:hypothetical protein
MEIVISIKLVVDVAAILTAMSALIVTISMVIT